jgi:hypothetical protein
MSLITTMPAFEVTGLTAEQRTALDEILRDVQTSVDRLARAAKRWVELPPRAREKIIEQTNPSFREFWKRLESVGSGALHPQLATVGGTAARLLGRLPLEEQDRYLRELLPVVVTKGRGWDVRLVDVAELTEDQRKQVFKLASDGGVTVREVEAQKVWVADRIAKRLVEASGGEALTRVERAGWRVERGRVWVKPGLVEGGITRKQLERMLADLE